VSSERADVKKLAFQTSPQPHKPHALTIKHTRTYLNKVVLDTTMLEATEDTPGATETERGQKSILLL
jgi:hypothetical protein